MSFTDKAEKIRRQLGKYTKTSVVMEELKRLNQKESSMIERVQKLPWLSYLMMEWLFQVEQSPNARVATSNDVCKIINRLSGLQGDAVQLNDPVKTELALRRLFINQLSCQRNRLYHQFTLVRLYCLMLSKSSSSIFKDDFKKETNIELNDFFVFSMWLITLLDEKVNLIKYEQLINNLYPHFSLEQIATMIKLIGGRQDKLEELMMLHRQECIRPEAFFVEPLLIRMPVLFFKNGICSLHDPLLSKGIGEFVLRLLKSANNERFRQKFTPIFESYVGKVLDESACQYLSENELGEIYKKHDLRGKVVDFLCIEESGTVFIDAKGIEPHQRILVSDNPKLIKDKLKSSFSKGIEQSFECARLLLQANEPQIQSLAERFTLIVTHQDFYLSNGINLKTQVSHDFFEKLELRYGQNIPVENVYFTSIEDFEGIVLICKESETELSEFLRFCTSQDAAVGTRKFDMRQHIVAYAEMYNLKRKSPIGSDYLMGFKKELFDEMIAGINTSNNYWKKSIPSRVPEFISCCNTLKNLLIGSST